MEAAGGQGWDGERYDRSSQPQLDAGAVVLGRISPPKGGVVVDAGCGSGRVTEVLLRERPDVRVVAIDASASMIQAARQRLDPFRDRVRLERADLSDDWPLAGPVDAVVSTSTFHWVLDHVQLFAHVHRALRPGGELAAVAGGAGSLRPIRDVAARLGVAVDGRNTAEETSARLADAGFVDVWTWLEAQPIRFPSRPAPHLGPKALTGPRRVPGCEAAPS